MSSNHDIAALIDTAFREFVGEPRFPCLAGKGVVRASGYALGVYGRLGSDESTRALACDLANFVADISEADASLRAFVAVFPDAVTPDEMEFERQLWRQLERLRESDPSNAEWDHGVSDDPEDAHFSFSHGGRALFVVGMHATSSRLSRRFQWPAMVFNPRAQFERLRATGKFEKLRSAVREREIALQGSLNPNLADFGEQSEARQYSGREVAKGWKCPFHPPSR